MSSPGLEYDAAVVRRLRPDSLTDLQDDESMNLLKLLCCLGGVDVPVHMLHRAMCPRIVWNVDGEIERRQEPDLHLGGLADHDKLQKAVQCLKTCSILVENGQLLENRTYSINPEIRMYAKQQSTAWDDWRLQALIVVCHAFPRDRNLESALEIHGNMQLKSLQHVLDYFVYANALALLSSRVKLLVAETLIAASAFSDIAWKFRVLDIAEQILSYESDSYLEVCAFQRRVLLNRLHPEKACEKPNGISKLTVWPNRFPYDRRSSAQYMRLIISSANELIMQDKFTEALSQLELIDLSKDNNPSTLEKIVLRRKERAVGRVFRFQGRFQEALECFKRVLPQHFQFTKSERSVISHLAGIFIELGNPLKAEKIIEEQLLKYKSPDKYLKIVLAEAKLHQRVFRTAEDICLELQMCCRMNLNPDINDDMFYLRVLTVLARIAHLEGDLPKALSLWEECLEALLVLDGRGCEKERFCYMIIIYSIADIDLKTAKFIEAGDRIAKARDIFKNVPREYWCTGLGTFWFDAIQTSVSESGGSRIDQ